ncbi:DUF192 domain-containing protein [Stenomitos frigidus]|uniref:DUF192 domain-containing protein n=1 Tax=Stenomitos frigidus ULC18 TaxID=2107698 RepID=A0A2T1E505_9CYAN|nr:DUF192 domain-containing protein [Stenomitos frigidus]PSB27811.1 hypothetical protein C7B82_15620 [Stenomitos frigidus ULC18]
MKHSDDSPVEALRWYPAGQFTGLLLACLLLGCSPSISDASSSAGSSSTPAAPATSQSVTMEAKNAGQRLPLSAQMTVADQVIRLEVARTMEQQEIGLMYRTELAKDQGMVFQFDPPRRTAFWMKNTLIPLDMVFLLKGKVQAIASNVPPCKDDPCPTYGPKALVDQVIELRAGRAFELGLKQGDRIVLQKL